MIINYFIFPTLALYESALIIIVQSIMAETDNFNEEEFAKFMA
jgi:hypothetical protein